MAFKLSVTDKVVVPIKFSLTDAGKSKPYAFTLTCDRTDSAAIQAMFKGEDAAEAGALEKMREKLVELTTGWAGQTLVCNDDGTPADFCAEAFDVLLGVTGVINLAFGAYMKEVTAKVKN